MRIRRMSLRSGQMCTYLASKAPSFQGLILDIGFYNIKLVRRSFDCWILLYTDLTSIAIASILISGVVSLHTLHRPSRAYTRKFLKLSYASQSDQIYKQGFDDLYFVIAWIVNFTALRAISIDWILRPAAKHLGVAKKSHLRFAEQGWLVLYHGTFWTLGMVWPPRSPSLATY